MRLTTSLREAICKAVMADVPSEDFKGQAQKLVLDWHMTRMPAKLVSAYNDPELRPHFVQSAGWIQGWNLIVPGNYYDLGSALPKPLFEKVVRLREKDQSQVRERGVLRDKVMAVLNSATTTKALADRFPDLSKYIPNEAPSKPKNALVTTDLTDALKKAGWKGTKK